MMRRKGLLKYTVFLLVCFFSLLMTTIAEEGDGVVTRVHDFPYGSTYTISKTGYEGFSCDIKSDSVFKYSTNENGYTLSLKQVMTKDGSETIRCTYSRKISIYAPGANTNGERKYIINYTAGLSKDFEYYLGFGVEFIDVAAQLGASKIVDYSVQAKGAEWISMSQCPKNSTSCKVYLSEQALNIDPLDPDNYLSTVVFKYQLPGSDSIHTANVIFNINAFQGAYIWESWLEKDKTVGICDYGSDWETAVSTDSGGQSYYYYRSTKMDSRLPNCTPRNNSLVPVQFKGWVKGVQGNTAVSKQLGGDTYLYALGTCSNTIPAGTVVESHAQYAPCYETNPTYVHLSLSTGKIKNNDGTWSTKGDSFYDYFHMGTSIDDEVVLPDVEYSGAFAENKALQCWENQSTNECVPPGTKVKTDGTIYVAVTNTTHVDYSYYKSVMKGDAVVFSVQGMKKCKIAEGQPSGYLSAIDYNGDCLVTGLELTNTLDPQYISVEVDVEDDGKRLKKVYNFSVEPPTGLTAGGNGTFFVDPLVNSGEENKYTDSSGFRTSSCTTFTISPGQSISIGGGLLSNTYSVTPSSDCSNDDSKYIAFCLDPGRAGPDYGKSYKYERVDDINSNTEMGKFIAFLAESKDIDIGNFGKVNDETRIAAHIAIRIIAIRSGFGTNTGIAYWGLQKPYQVAADTIAEEKPTTAGGYAKIIKDAMGIKDRYAELAGQYLAEYAKDYDPDESLGFERTIDFSEAVAAGNGYIITYKGTITAPENASNVKMTAPGPNNGISEFKVVDWQESEKLANGRTVYKYEVQIRANNTMLVVPPTNDEQKMKLSFKITFDGGQSVSNIFIAQPIEEAGKLQRMIIFDTDAKDLFIYFNIAPNNCELPGLDYKKCTGEDSCPSTEFNKELFKASGCCRYITDETPDEGTGYDPTYVLNNVCAAKCTTSTMSNVCDYKSMKLAEMYEIKEGSKYSSGKYTNAIGSCIADVDKPFVNSYNNHTDYSSDPSDPVTKTAHEFENFDDNGNSLMVEYYERDDNQYCRINCKEDWKISMDGFGNYVGKNAVAAGSYFAIENDIFIGGKRTCYTNYIDYHKYMNELAHLAAVIISAYNEYSKESHSYSDFDEIQTSSDNTVESNGKVIRYKRWITCSRSCTNPSDPDGSGPLTAPDPSCSNSCTTHAVDSGEISYYEFTLDDVKHKFAGSDAPMGQYQTYSSELFDAQDGYDSTQHKTDKQGTPAYSTDHTKSIECTPDIEEPVSCEGELPTGLEEGSCTGESVTDGLPSCTFAEITEDDKAQAFDVLQPLLLTDIEGELNGLRGTIGSAANSIRKKIDDMYDCQHFQLINTTDENSDFADTKKLVGAYHANGSKDYIHVSTAFDPRVTYEYAEDAYMSILLRNKEDYLVMHEEKNNSIYQSAFKQDYKDATNKSTPATVKLTGGDNPQTTTVDLARNKHAITYYNIGSRSGMWAANTDPWRNYGGSGVGHSTVDYGIDSGYSNTHGKYMLKQISLCGITGDSSGASYVTSTNFKGVSSTVLVGGSATPNWKGGSCFNIKVPYLQANYISASLENSSFYRNQGTWYSNIQDVKAHGENLKTALENENAHVNAGYNISEELDSERWGPVGLELNIFPVSLSTPRNLYTYTYTFFDIGSESGGQLGRIMGSDTAIIANNNRTCFYEVFEELCLCCGDKINTYVFNDPDENDLIEQVMKNSGYGGSNADKIEENEGGTLSFATSTVNLSDVDVDANARPTASNWSDNAPFTYGGEYDLSTSKGDQLKNAIESQGETIYSSLSTNAGPEYAYYLTPTTLSEIREYNDAHGYELNFNNLKVYGRYSIAALGGCSDPTDDDKCWVTDPELFNDKVVNFQHYGSLFLEDLAKDPTITKSSTLAREGNSKVCLVVDKQFTADTINTLVKDGCRWIDYVENISDNNTGKKQYIYPYAEYTSSAVPVTYFRLAFK